MRALDNHLQLRSTSVSIRFEKVRELNYDHHRRMTELAGQYEREGKTAEIVEMDDESYRTLLLRVPKNRSSILELGSSQGGQFPLLRTWLKQDGLIYGIDLYEPNVRAAQACGMGIELGFVEDMHMFPNESFDLVCSRHVMEHLGDVEKGMSEILRVLRPNGYFAHVTPDLPFDDEPAHLNKLHLQEWTGLWQQMNVKLLSAKFYPYFHHGEVHIVGTKI